MIAFFNGVLEVEIYIDQLKSYVQEGNEHIVCKVKKILYGLKQLPMA